MIGIIDLRGLRARNRNLCYELLALVHEMTDGFGMAGDASSGIVYDCKSSLFTAAPIKPERVSPHWSCPLTPVLFKIEVHIPETMTANKTYIRHHLGEASYTILIIPNSSGHVIQLDDFRQYQSGESVHGENRTIRTFLELAVAQSSINK